MLKVIQEADQALFLFLNGLHTPYWDHFMWIVSAKLTWVPLYAALLYVLCRNFKLRMTFFIVIVLALLIAFSDQICASVIRPLAERLRPSNPDNPLSGFVHILHNKRGGKYGFPSCHASNSFALTFFIMRLFKQSRTTVFLLCWASLNAYSRVYLGVHYPGDLFAGMFVGLCGAETVYFLFRHTLRSKRCISLLRITPHDSELIAHPQKIKHTATVLYAGLLTLLSVAVHSAFNPF